MPVRSLAAKQSLLTGPFFKRATATMGSAGGVGTGSWTTTLEGTLRYQDVLPLTPTRFRVRVLNAKAGATNAGGPLNLKSFWIGTPAPNTGTDRRWNGAFSAAPTKLSTTNVDIPGGGVDYVSGWFPNVGLIKAMQPFGISIGVNNTSGTAVPVFQDRIGGLFFAGAGASDDAAAGATGLPLGVSAPSGLTAFIDVRVEYEYASTVDPVTALPTIPHVLVIGDSISAGANGVTTTTIHAHEAWPGVASLAQKFALTNLAVSGSTAAGGWLSAASSFYKRADMSDGVALGIADGRPDYAIISLGINDVVANATTSALQSNIITIMQNVLALNPNCRIFLGTMIPAGGNRSPMGITGATIVGTGSPNVVFNTANVASGSLITNANIPANTYINVVDNTYGVMVDAAGNLVNGLAAASGQTVNVGSPSSYITSFAQEANRMVVNKWIRSMPYNCAGVFDFDAAIRIPNLQHSADPAFLTAYPHPEVPGYQRMGSLAHF